MKTRILLMVLVTVIAFSCKPDKQKKLNELKKQQAALSEKIKMLEQELAASGLSKAEVGKIITIEDISVKPFYHYIEVQGKLDGDENIGVTSVTGGLIKAVYVKAGDMVKKDQVIIELDHDALSAQLKSLETNLQFATQMFDKQQKLWDQKIGSEVQYLQSKTTKESLESQVKSVREQIDLMLIKSPVNGAVEDIPVRVGQMMAPGITTIRVVSFNKIKVVADVAEGYASKVKQGDKVKVIFPDINKEATASINFASRYINPINRTFSVEAYLLETIPDLKANMVAMLRIVDYNNDKAISLSINYVQNDQKGNYVYIAKEGKAKKLPVKLGQIYNGIAEITEGLKPGDKVITSGYLELEEGQTIRF